jgi:hypothetical protein
MRKINSLFAFSVLLIVSFLEADAQNNTYTGTNAGNGTSTGLENSGFGYNAADVIASGGNYNSAFGSSSGKSVTTGDGNSFLGYQSGYSISTSGYNTFIGYQSGYSNTNSSNVFLGAYAGRYSASGSNSVYIGYQSGYNNTAGIGNIFLGYGAGYNETGSNKLYIDNSTVSTPLIYGDFSSNQVGINSLPSSTYTLTVGGTIHTTGLYVNGSQAAKWDLSGSNISYQAGSVSIGTTNPQGYKLAVAGKIISEEVVIKLLANWPDYVFERNYNLLSLPELEKFILANKHLPGVPTAEQVTKVGIEVGEMNAILLKKVEELTLHIITLEKRVKELEK